MSTAKPYRGKLQAVILDWAGTTVDHGSLAPVRVLEKVFAGRGVHISSEEARLNMGLLKKDHIRCTLMIPRIRTAWAARYDTEPNESDVEQLFADFIPQQLDCLAEYSTLIPGLTRAVDTMRRRGLKIGTTTGYTRPMLDLLLAVAADQGYVPDSSLCPDDVGGGRPFPWMCYQTAINLKVYPLYSFVKIGDTISDIEEALNSEMWAVGVARTGNLIGLTEAGFAELEPAVQQARLDASRSTLLAAGAHYCIDTIGDIEPVLDQIDERLSQGERP
jgi:phosphonoacetaldehyde hydrolase